MPVADTPVHPLTVGSERYDACQKKERRDGYYVKDGYSFDFELQWKYIEDTASRDCRYDQKLTDPQCEGCNRRSNT